MFLIYYCVLLLSHTYDIQAQDASTVNYYERLMQRYIDEYSQYTVVRNAYKFRPNNVDRPPQNYGDYDFIVIGSGAGGSTVASRLSEVDDFKVLLLEAGEHETNFTDIPWAYFYLAKSPYNWGYLTVPQENACLGEKIITHLILFIKFFII